MINDLMHRVVSKYSKKLTRDEAMEFLNEKSSLLPKGIGVQFWEDGGGESQDYDHRTKIINLHEKELTEIVILHEIGHANLSAKKGTSNYFINNEKLGRIFPSIRIYESEMEAWEFVKTHLGRPMTFNEKLDYKLSLRSYAPLKKGNSIVGR